RRVVSGHPLSGRMGRPAGAESSTASAGAVSLRGHRTLRAYTPAERAVSNIAGADHQSHGARDVSPALSVPGDDVIRLEQVSKSYLTLRGRKQVLRNLDLEIPSGLNVGLIGRNGAGKSTLMRLLSAVDLPDSGKIITKGTLSWPVGLSGGMQTTLSGRENVKFVCRIHGLRGAQMREKLKYVQEFVQLGEYFDQPVSTYSSGMRARLAFGTSMAFDF